MGIVAVLLVVALVLFTLSTFGVGGKYDLTAAGLACLTLAGLISRGML